MADALDAHRMILLSREGDWA
jgi:hypothetical protein